MTGGGGDELPPSNGGEFLLSLLQRPNFQPQTPPAPPQQSLFPTPAAPITPPQPLPRPSQQQQPQPQPLPPQPHQQQASLSLDPAVAAVGPSIPFTTPPQPLWASGGRDLLSTPPPWPHTLSPPQGLPPTFLGFPQGPWPSHIQANQFALAEDLQRLGLNNNSIHNFYQHRPLQLEQKQQQQQQQKLQFGSFDEPSFNINAKLNAVKERELLGTGGRNLNGGLERNGPFDPHSNSIPANFDSGELDRARGKQQQRGGGNQRSGETRMPPPGFSNNQRGGGGGGGGAHWDSVGRGGHWDSVSRGRALDRNVYKDKANQIALSNRNKFLRRDDERASSSDGSVDLGLARQLEHPGPPAGSKLHSVSATDIEESLVNLEAEVEESGKEDDHELEDLGEELVDSLLHDGESDGKIEKKQPNRNVREKESRSDNRGKCILSRRMRMLKRQIECRRDIDRMNVPFLAIYESLIPPEEEKAKQKQLFTLLQKLVKKEWPEAQLYLYGSCANSFGVSRSDIDVCLAMEDPGINKSEVLLKLAEILVADNLQNVQALTRARVPIVKLMDPVTGISCDICINNVLAVVNTKLLRDYAEIDVRLRQLAFVVKHWAKSRGVNETYQGTLSSYAYVLMCIHFLQQRRPAILPCLQEMDATYSVTVDDIECSYFDQVEKLRGFGSRNKEPIAQLVWAFFNYWAYCHDYANSVISVRTGSIISKQEKDWTRRIGNDRHLICIEDPFEISHDLGRVVDKFSIRVLRDEFERAAEIMQYDRNPCVTLFERYVEST